MGQALADNFGDFTVDGRVFEQDDFADHVVGKLIIYQFLDVAHNLVNESALLQETPSLKAFLHHTAALFVLGDLKAVLNDSDVNGVLMFVFGHDV